MVNLYYFVLLILSVYSYTLVDPNITLLNNNYWTDFRNYMVYWGYYRRDITSIIYLVLIALLLLFYFYIIKHYKKYNSVRLAFVIAAILLISYPFLSHDFFNYMFDAKILTFYHQNPYTHKALDFPNDSWIRFMHWTHRTYPYGPLFLVITLIPSFLSFGKFIMAFGLFKVLFSGVYILSVYYLNKLNKKWAVMFAVHPLVIVEGLLNLHNDLIGVGLAIVGFYYLIKNQNVRGRLLLAASFGIKYITLPLFFISKKNIRIQYSALIGIILILGYLSFWSEVQPWYFITLLALLPFFENWITRLNIFFAGLLFSYYPFIRFGQWGIPESDNMKHIIIITFLILNIIYLVNMIFLSKRK